MIRSGGHCASTVTKSRLDHVAPSPHYHSGREVWSVAERMRSAAAKDPLTEKEGDERSARCVHKGVGCKKGKIGGTVQVL